MADQSISRVQYIVVVVYRLLFVDSKGAARPAIDLRAFLFRKYSTAVGIIDSCVAITLLLNDS